MSNELTDPQKNKTALDGFDFEERFEGNDEEHAGGVIQGALVKFTNEVTWVANGEELPADLELIAIDVLRIVQRWKDKTPIETMVVEPGQPIPDVEAMNEKVPKSEWVDGADGKKRGPWQFQRLFYLLDPRDMTKYTYATGTVGGEIAIREITDKTKWMRRFRGGRIYPVLVLSDTHMRTKFGGRQRPHFIIKRWVQLGEDGSMLPGPEGPPKIEAPKTPAAQLRAVAEPKLDEQMNDTIPF